MQCITEGSKMRAAGHTVATASTIAAVTVGNLMELGVTRPMPTFNASADPSFSRSEISCSGAAGVVHRLLRDR